MAESGWLPAFLTRVSKTNVPVVALALSCMISAVFAALPFGKLVILDILLYSAALVLEFVAFLVLRKREPEMARAFRVRGGWWTAILISVLPTAFAAVVLVATLADETENYAQLMFVAFAIFSGVAVYFLRNNAAKGFGKTRQS
jgi:amino acid transporter